MSWTQKVLLVLSTSCYSSQCCSHHALGLTPKHHLHSFLPKKSTDIPEAAAKSKRLRRPTPKPSPSTPVHPDPMPRAYRSWPAARRRLFQLTILDSSPFHMRFPPLSACPTQTLSLADPTGPFSALEDSSLRAAVLVCLLAKNSRNDF